ncbi:cysteine dioxygenase family protein [Legionella bozemanae]|uniref:Putative Cupin region protein n=1 Tax=Legionella bozemanae TaxID=447 RepID=A0A0W0RWS9_LEGBO|nr:cysteine dioxygenase family protein [Legionella bozemanae]KTC75429.1 putative Cupin region protein [Legionella bozemanae]STO34275.1 Predicted metal-dependent enzyme of the double-stranded beta helix superfamily [Legionella bozemanae]
MDFYTPSGLLPLIQELRQLNILEHDNHDNMKKVSLILRKWVKKTDWLEEHFYAVDPVNGFTSWLIFEEPDHSLAVNLVAWEPGREITPHDHKTWGVVGCVTGVEKNFFWLRRDDGSQPGYADIKKQNKPIICFPGDVITFNPDDIHSVVNIADSVAISLHVYGKNLNYTHRFQYNPMTNTAEPFIVDFN